MELTISKRQFLRVLSRTHGVADRKSSMPILSNVLLTAEKSGTLRVAATDLYLGVVATATCDVKEPGVVAISARTAFEVVKNMPEGVDMTLKSTDNSGVEISSGKVRYRLPGFTGNDFPGLPTAMDTAFVEIDGEMIASLIAKTQYSMSTDDTRPHLAGAFFEGEGGTLRMVTTDGHRLSKAQTTMEAKQPLQFSMLIPNRGVVELKRLIDDAKSERAKGDEHPVMVGVATVAGQAFFRREGIQLSIKLAEDQFPPYSKVIPQSHERRVVASRLALIEALKRISLVAQEKSGAVRLHIESGLLRITSENPEVGEGLEELDVDYAADALDIGFNAKYILDVLSSLNYDNVAIELSGSLDPGVIKPETSDSDFVGVIMPMRI